MTGEEALACIEQERLDVMAEGMTAAECENMAAYVLASEYRKLLAAQSESVRTWIPISERQPEGRDEVLVVTVSGSVSTRGAAWVRELWREATTEKFDCALTHWMSLPERP